MADSATYYGIPLMQKLNWAQILTKQSKQLMDIYPHTPSLPKFDKKGCTDGRMYKKDMYMEQFYWVIMK